MAQDDGRGGPSRGQIDRKPRLQAAALQGRINFFLIYQRGMRSAVLLFLASFTLFAFADEEGNQAEEWHRPPHPKTSSLLAGKYMTGNWDGWRDVLEEHGVVFGSFFLTECM